ncbi:MAG: alginate lyase family protein [Planctomycetota bacterium]|nr:alginate lyase family protein [Planctomycetota bacterium]
MAQTSLWRRCVRYIHFARFLQPSQFFWRLWNIIWQPIPNLRPPPLRDQSSGYWLAPGRRVQGLVNSNRFRFLNVERELRFPGAWNDMSFGRRWLYDLHSFHYLNARGWEKGHAWHQPLIRRWIDDNRPAAGIGWHPYLISLRIVNWIKWALAGNELPAEAKHSLAVQTRFLSTRLERELMANHLLANGKGLVFAGLFFEGVEAEGWLRRGLRILHREFEEQVLDDGGHFERSPMYHSIVLEDCLDLWNLLRFHGRESLFAWHDHLHRMRSWLRAMCHPDGQVALFNDTALNIAASPGEIESYARRLGLTPTNAPGSGILHLRDSGFVRMAKGPCVAIVDVAPLGPDYQVSHGHADNLTFELSLSGERVVVDTGISRYDRSPERLQQRETAAHNTVVVDSHNSSDVWGGFKVGKRAKTVDVSVAAEGKRLRLQAAHDGYRRFAGVGHHRRSWDMSDGELIITDTVEGHGRHAVEVIFHFHPRICLIERDPHVFLLMTGQDERLAAVHMDHRLKSDARWTSYHPEFGLDLPNRELVGRWIGELPVRFETKLAWA